MAINPNILFKGGLVSPFSSYQEGQRIAQERDLREQQLGLANLQAQEAERKAEQAQILDPLKLEQQQLVMNALRRDEEREIKKTALGERYRSGELTEDEFITEYSGLYPSTIPGRIQKRKAHQQAERKYLLDREDKLAERKIKQDRLFNDTQRFAFDQLKLQYELDKPFREEKINQSFMANELSANLAQKRNPNVRLTKEKLKDVTARSVKTPQVMRIVSDINNDITQYGTEQLPSKAKKRMEANLRLLQGILKSEKFINLGVLTGPDLEFLEDITGDPTGFFNLSAENILEKMGTLKKNTIEEFNTAMVNNGFNAFSENEIINLIPKSPGKGENKAGVAGSLSIPGGGQVFLDPNTGKWMTQ
jgi:hypothetical protein